MTVDTPEVGSMETRFELMGLIPGAGYELIRKAGHLPCVEQPELYAKHLMRFLESIGHSKNG